MNIHADKTQENKSQSSTNAVSQKSSSRESAFRFVDNRPEAVVQRKLQGMANNNPQVQQANQLQAMVDRSRQLTSEQGMVNYGKVIQLKPANITNHRNTLTMDGTGGGTPRLVNNAAQRANKSVAYPINSMIEGGLIDSSDAPLTGGHLFKAQYGGIDDITNVVPWNDSAERSYSTFENAYLRYCKELAQQNGGQQASIDVVATAKFDSDSSKRKGVANVLRGVGNPEDARIRRTIASLVQYSSESVPTSVEAFGEVNGNKVRGLKYKETKLIDKKELTGRGIRELFNNVKQKGWTGKPKGSIEKLSEWENISE